MEQAVESAAERTDRIAGAWRLAGREAEDAAKELGCSVGIARELALMRTPRCPADVAWLARRYGVDVAALVTSLEPTGRVNTR